MLVSILKDEEGTIITNKEKIEKFCYKSYNKFYKEQKVTPRMLKLESWSWIFSFKSSWTLWTLD